MFFSQYWLFACQYSNTASDIPLILSGKDPNKEPQKFCIRRSTQQGMLIANIVLSALNGLFYALVHSANSQRWEGTAHALSMVVDSVLIFVTGFILIESVIKIRQALRDRRGDANLKQMAIHATAFGLFVVSFIGARFVLLFLC